VGQKGTADGHESGRLDFILVPPAGQLHCLELKRIGGTLSHAREDFRLWCVRYGIPHVVAYSIDDVLVAFEAWGCLNVKVAGGVK
jgi:hypothetical protein